MEFGIGFDTHVDKWDLARYVEELGYDRCWVPDFANDLVGLLRGTGARRSQHEAY